MRALSASAEKDGKPRSFPAFEFHEQADNPYHGKNLTHSSMEKTIVDGSMAKGPSWR
jgi:hypothetical protein